MPIGAAPEPGEGETAVVPDWVVKEEEETAVVLDWAMLDRIGRTRCHEDLDAARRVVNKNKTAARLFLDGGDSCFVSFTLAPPEGISYLNLHWPVGEGSDTEPTAYPFVRATDKDLVLFDIDLPNRSTYLDAPPDLFVYTAAGSPPSVKQLPPHRTSQFLMDKFATGILRLSENSYIVADLSVVAAELCVFYSKTKKWKIISNIPALQPLQRIHPLKQNQSSARIPDLWSTDDVLAFDGRFLCWVDYFSGVLLCDLSDIDSPVLHFVPFPGEKKYPDEVRISRHFPGRFRSVSNSKDKLCFVHIDNDFHERIHNDWPWHRFPERSQHQGPQKVTIWTLNPNKFEWEQPRAINLDHLWAQPPYKALHIDQCLPEFPVISMHDPDVLCCLLRKEEFHGDEWMIMVDMKHAQLQSCTPYINRQSYCAKCLDDEAHEGGFGNITLLPTVFPKHLERPTGITLDNDKVATYLSKKHKLVSKKRKLKCAKVSFNEPQAQV